MADTAQRNANTSGGTYSRGSIASASKDDPLVVGGDIEGDHYITSADRRQLGFWSAVFLIFNRMVGTGIFATPSSIVALSGSVGLSLLIWVVGIVIAFAGAFVFLEFGTGMPRNGGEKNYLEYVFTRPRFLVTAMYASNVMLLGWAGSNSVVFGEYILHAAGVEVDRWNQRGVGVACVTSAFLIHGCALKWGVRLQNLLGCIKLGILLLIVVAGFVALAGHLKIDEKPDNFTNAFEGTTASAYGIVTALYNVIWSLSGYSNANYALSETKNPVKTLKLALPTALGLVSVLYMFVNIAYFAAVPKAEIVSSGRILAASFFRNVMGEQAERALSVFVALSAFGNVLALIFCQGRLVQEIGREGILPFSKFFASNKPFNAPLAGLFEHWLVSVSIMLAPPPGDAYNFILKYVSSCPAAPELSTDPESTRSVISYPVSVINVFVSIALIRLYLKPYSEGRNPPQWAPPFRATLPITFFFLLSNLFLVLAPFVPPDAGQNVYKSLPYWLHCVVAVGIFFVGAVYWLFWAKILPRLGNYELVRVEMVGEDGWSQNVFVRKPKAL
ncbi:high-affinity methionine permease [Drepanopeziza brunnea f. sp. 'multigermtubi' MB_m1]|uniref:High-affinity methionine permease n=1 Tax=Marssonina brunnea f. sp. multigermtubi (strain MB_m1) TaxID=1072389 RepID=K1X3A5_MARBU|nr:high-affinity methionine permease [Drepanopeziza brunnea f. sp. 'multigermtubi' MB_m1]EKD19507.1 high-affinity methionine permease [Drepanopeziza brunnea f. sp. 'multigermtubi' MB_m1]